ncbi:TonB-dependent receptor [Aliifodinibius sp. S!AR15-10]|uniref:SusC/RagA family TonB-linked outer membrane protein n=1 Tax=Aliifodinibius sp. S!AR15-10 TaxID=2950437 RepID=UPI00286637D2|nr:TonB-dependent receptor [Aliifodinibius sp. S!AR15-10]MDR8394082.1 TonB-dependent receptor [Aliifodinibius sp. S!AR15-10]
MKKLRLTMMLLLSAFVIQGMTSMELMAQVGSTSSVLLSSTDINSSELQNKKVVALAELLEELERNMDVTFLYKDNAVKNKFVNPGKIGLNGETGKNLATILDDLGLAFERLDEQTYVLFPKKPARKKEAVEQVSGTVTDAETADPMPGVNISVKGTNTGTSTGANGGFSLNVSSLSDTLVFSFIGYQTTEIAINGRTSIDVAMQPVAISGEEVVVVGYGQQQRRDITSSISSVSAEDIANEPAQQVAQSLQGKVSGVQITQNSGNPGSDFMMRVRGVGSVNDRSTQPLYVVDGNPMADPNDISPSQVQSIEVLKSASATAIYGARGANGVVLITTKGGRDGNIQFDLDIYNGVKYGRRVPLTNARDYAMLYNEAETNSGNPPIFDNPDSFGEGTDWQDVAYRTGQTRNVNMSISGGNENSTYFFSGQYETEDGVVRTTNFDRVSLRLNSQHDITPFITIGENISFSRSKSRGMGLYSTGGFFNRGIARDPTVPVKNPDGSWGQLPRGSNLEAQFQREEDQDDGTERPVLTGSGFIEITPLDNLTFRSQYNFVYGSSLSRSFNPTYFISTTDQNELSSISRSESNWNNWNLENTVNYQNTIGRHNFEALVGITAQETFTESWSASADALPANSDQFKGLRYLGLAESGQDVGGSGGGFAMLSYLGRINYDYNDRYLATINYRVDGSSKFGQNNQYGYFPSFSLGWRLSSEPFMQDLDFINNLLIRGGWGQIGNQNSLPNYAYTSSVTRGMNYTFNDNWIPGQAPEGSGNPDLKWESIQETNIGFSFTGFNNTINVDFDYYNKITTDMLLQVPVVAYSGIVEPAFRNGGEILNEGVELSVGYQRTTPGDFYYSVNANVSYNRNELTELTAQTSTILGGWVSFIGDNYLTRATVGNPIGIFYGYESDGIFQNQAEVDNHATQPNAAPGDLRFKDLDGNGVIDDQDQTVIGNPWPDYTFGLSANFAYKNFDLNLGFTGQLGNDIFAAWKWTWYGGNWFNYHEDALGRWTGEETSNDIPRLHINDPNNNLRNSSWYVEDGSYLRLNNLQLGYSVPQSVANIRELRVFVTATNVFTITGYPGQDPELGTTDDVPFDAPLMVGIDAGHYAVPRTYTIGVNIGL